MLAHILAIAVAVSSLVLFLTAFSMTEIHEKNDFLWSGVGFFYALVLWFCASRITGGVLLGQVAAVTLVLYFNWQNINLRKAIASPNKAVEQVETNENKGFSIIEQIKGFFSRVEVSTPPPSITDILEEETKIENTDRDITEAEPLAEIPSSSSAETDISSTESNNSITEIDTTSDLTTGVVAISEQVTVLEEIIVPTVEEELVETPESSPTENNEPDIDEEAITVPEITETEAKEETNAEFNLESPLEEIMAEKPIDVEFTPSTIEEIQEDTTSSIDDFLADLDNSADKPTDDK